MLKQHIYRRASDGYRLVGISETLNTGDQRLLIERMDQQTGLCPNITPQAPVHRAYWLEDKFILGRSMLDPNGERQSGLSHQLVFDNAEDLDWLDEHRPVSDLFLPSYMERSERDLLSDRDLRAHGFAVQDGAQQGQAMLKLLFGNRLEILPDFLAMLRSVAEQKYLAALILVDDTPARVSDLAYQSMEMILRGMPRHLKMRMGYRSLWYGPEETSVYPISFSTPAILRAEQRGLMLCARLSLPKGVIETPDGASAVPDEIDRALAEALLDANKAGIAACREMRAAKLARRKPALPRSDEEAPSGQAYRREDSRAARQREAEAREAAQGRSARGFSGSPEENEGARRHEESASQREEAGRIARRREEERRNGRLREDGARPHSVAAPVQARLTPPLESDQSKKPAAPGQALPLQQPLKGNPVQRHAAPAQASLTRQPFESDPMQNQVASDQAQPAQQPFEDDPVQKRAASDQARSVQQPLKGDLVRNSAVSDQAQPLQQLLGVDPVKRLKSSGQTQPAHQPAPPKCLGPDAEAPKTSVLKKVIGRMVTGMIRPSANPKPFDLHAFNEAQQFDNKRMRMQIDANVPFANGVSNLTAEIIVNNLRMVDLSESLCTPAFILALVNVASIYFKIVRGGDPTNDRLFSKLLCERLNWGQMDISFIDQLLLRNIANCCITLGNQFGEMCCRVVYVINYGDYNDFAEAVHDYKIIMNHRPDLILQLQALLLKYLEDIAKYDKFDTSLLSPFARSYLMIHIDPRQPDNGWNNRKSAKERNELFGRFEQNGFEFVCKESQALIQYVINKPEGELHHKIQI